MTVCDGTLPYCERHNIGRRFQCDGVVYECVGIMLDELDWGYVMHNVASAPADGYRVLSCVGSIEGYGFDPVP